MEALELHGLGRTAVVTVGGIVADLSALEVAEDGPLLVETLVGLVVLEDILRMRMVLEIAAEPVEVLIVDNEVDIVVPWDEPAVAQGSNNVSAVDTARHSNLLCRRLKVDGHVEKPQLGFP